MTTEAAIHELVDWLKLMDHDPADSTPLEDAVVEAIDALKAVKRAALVSGEGESRRENTKEDHSAGLIHQVASPLAESEPRPGCANTKTCREPCEDDDGCSYCTRCGLWEGAK